MFRILFLAGIALILGLMLPTIAGATVDMESIYLAPESTMLVSSTMTAGGPQQASVTVDVAQSKIIDFDTTSCVTTATVASAAEHYIDTIGHLSARVPANPQPRHLLRT